MLQNDSQLHTNSERILNLNQGNKKAFQLIFDEWYEHMCFFAHRILNDHTIAEDIVQDAFINLWKNKEKIETEEHIKAFLYKVVRNKCINHIKHEEIKRKYAKNFEHPIESDDFFVRLVIEEETKRLIFETEEQLTQKQKEVFKLAMKGFNNQEISKELGISINTVKTHKRIAYGILKKKIEKTMTLILFLWI